MHGIRSVRVDCREQDVREGAGAVKFLRFEICDASGNVVPRQHPHVYIAVASITRVVKEPDAEDVTYLDLGTSGVWVRGDYIEIAGMLNDPFHKATKVEQMVRT